MYQIQYKQFNIQFQINKVHFKIVLNSIGTNLKNRMLENEDLTYKLSREILSIVRVMWKFMKKLLLTDLLT